MALIKCPNCGNNVSDRAENCIHCGYKLNLTVAPVFTNNVREGVEVYKQNSPNVSFDGQGNLPKDNGKKKSIIALAIGFVLAMFVFSIVVLVILLPRISSNTSENSESEKTKVDENLDPLSKDMIDKIDSIGEVTLEDQELIEDLLETYSEMTESQKNQVSNYIILKNDKEELDSLLVEQYDSKFERQREYYDFVSEGIDYLKTQLKHASTLEVTGVILTANVVNKDEDSLLSKNSMLIEYSAENDLGNSVSGYAHYSLPAGGQFVSFDDKNQINYLNYENVIKKGPDASTNAGIVENYQKEEDNAYSYKKTFYVFQLDIEDYKAQGYTNID